MTTGVAAESRTTERGGRLGRPYWRLWSAAVISRLGDSLRTPALALLAASLTRDPRVLAAVVIAGQLPPLLFGLLGGVYADRWDRRRTMAAVDGARAVLVAAFAVLVATGQANVVALAGCAFALATLGTLFDASAFAILPAIVPADRLPAANGRLQAGTAVAGGFVGAPAAGVLFALAAALPFAADAVSFGAAALLALTLRPGTGSGPGAAAKPGTAAGPARSAGLGTPVAPAGPVAPAAPGRRSVWREAGDGLRWIRRDPVLLRMTTLTAASNLAISGMVVVLVLYALDVLKVSEAGYGLFMSAAVIGGLAGGLGAGRLAARFGTLPGMRLILAAQTLALAVLAVSRHPVPGALALAVFAAGTSTWNSLWAAYGQRRVPATMLGRVGSAQRMAGLLTAPVGAAVAGFAAEAYGLPTVVYGAAGILAITTLGAWSALRSGR
jgi:MFS family permease